MALSRELIFDCPLCGLEVRMEIDNLESFRTSEGIPVNAAPLFRTSVRYEGRHNCTGTKM